MKDLMIDIETLSTDNRNAVITSICLTPFQVMDKAQWGVKESVLLYPSLSEQILAGRIIDEKTVKFWAEHPDASARWETGQNLQASTLDATAAQLERVMLAMGSLESTRIWANGMLFDLGNLVGLYDLIGKPLPWRYNAPRDARTIYRLMPEEPMDTIQTMVGKAYPQYVNGAEHDPMYDNLYQIVHLTLALDYLNNHDEHDTAVVFG